MRVGIAIPSLHGGGAELIARRWADELVRRGHEVFVYLYAPQATLGPKDPAGLVDPAVQVRVFPHDGRLGRLLNLPSWLRDSAEDDRLDTLLTMLTYTNIAAAIGWRRGPRPHTRLLLSERNSPTGYLPLRGRSSRWQVPVARRVYRWADGVVAISHPVAGELVGGYGVPIDRCFVVPNAVHADGDALAPMAARSSTTVGFVGRLVAQKGTGQLVATLAALARNPLAGEVRGVVIGAGPLEYHVRAAADRDGVAIELLGWREPWQEAARAAGVNVLLLPSHVEGFGNVLVEAAAAGIPSVAPSSALGVADALVPGITGELATTNAPEELAAAVLRAAQLDVRGPHVQRWLARFGASASADVLERVIAPR